MTDVIRVDAPLVVGAGVAGLTVALGLPRAHLLSATEMGSSWSAQGGIAAALDDDDSVSEHATDTLAASGGIGVESAVEVLTSGGPEAVERLVALGAAFDRDSDGRYDLGRERGHRHRRTVHADGDATGAEVMRALLLALEAADTVTTAAGTVVELVAAGRRVAGVVVADGMKRSVVIAPAVVLASGGAGRLFARTTNPAGVTGDGIAMAARAGARLADLEFVDFHPTALDAGKDPFPLLSGALRDEGAKLVDAHGRRFMDRYHPDAELAPRDTVARAILWQYDKGLGAYLDCREIPGFSDRFPTVCAHAASVGLDPTTDLLPVSPAAHYYLGGVDADVDGRTSVPGLWAVGECASTGVHGANRLSSNSLLEGLVFGARVAVDVASGIEDPSEPAATTREALDLPLRGGPALEDVRQIMWDRVGPVRTDTGLWEARNVLMELEPVLRRTLQGRVALELGLMMVLAALRRSESRGAHYRSDYPDPDPMQAHRVLVDPASSDRVAVT